MYVHLYVFSSISMFMYKSAYRHFIIVSWLKCHDTHESGQLNVIELKFGFVHTLTF